MSESEAAAHLAKRFMPKLWVGYGIAIFVGVSEFFLPEESTFWETPHAAPAPFDVGFMIGLFFWAYCVYKLHELPNAMLGSGYPIPAGRAAGFHFIPIYGFYWLFRWTELYAQFLNARAGTYLISGSWLGLWLLTGFFLRLVDGALSLLVLFSGLSYLCRTIRRAAPRL